MIHGEGRTGPFVHQFSYENVWNVKNMTEKEISNVIRLFKVTICIGNKWCFMDDLLEIPKINHEKVKLGPVALVALYYKLLSMISYHESY